MSSQSYDVLKIEGRHRLPMDGASTCLLHGDHDSEDRACGVCLVSPLCATWKKALEEKAAITVCNIEGHQFAPIEDRLNFAECGRCGFTAHVSELVEGDTIE